jgi:hypothetical protein
VEGLNNRRTLEDTHSARKFSVRPRILLMSKFTLLLRFDECGVSREGYGHVKKPHKMDYVNSRETDILESQATVFREYFSSLFCYPLLDAFAPDLTRRVCRTQASSLHPRSVLEHAMLIPRKRPGLLRVMRWLRPEK